MNYSRNKKRIRITALMMALCLMYTSTPAMATGIQEEEIQVIAETEMPETAAEESGEMTEPETKAEILETEAESEESKEKFTWGVEDIIETTRDKNNKKDKNKKPKDDILEEIPEETTDAFEIEESAEELIPEFENNEELIAHQTIVVPQPEKENEFRFTWNQEATQAILLPNANVYEEPFVVPKRKKDRRNWQAPRIVGMSLTGCQVYILEENIRLENSKKRWYYVESGVVRGFVCEDDLLMDKTMIDEFLLENFGEQVLNFRAKLAAERAEEEAFEDIPEEARTTETWDDSLILIEVDEEAEETSLEEILPEETTEEETTGITLEMLRMDPKEEIALIDECKMWMVDAYPTVSPMFNRALNYSLTTGYDPVVKKDYAIARKEILVYSQKNIFDPNAQVVGVLPEGGVAYVLDDEGGLVAYVESGEVRGFTAVKNLYRGKKAKNMLKEVPAKERYKAMPTVDPMENPALYYTIKSVYQATPHSALRKAMIQFALQFVGNPYVWGGESLTNGADCSGFVRQIYKTYGINLPRTSREQSKVGMQIPVEDALPGDLIFYAKNGTVYHVTMYMGNGRVVQAANHVAGIITSPIGNNAVWACRIIQ